MQITGLNFISKVYQKNNQQNTNTNFLSQNNTGDVFIKSTPNVNNSVSFGAKSDVQNLSTLLYRANSLLNTLNGYRNLVHEGNTQMVNSLNKTRAELKSLNKKIGRIIYPKMKYAVNKLRQDMAPIFEEINIIMNLKRTVFTGNSVKTKTYFLDGKTYTYKPAKGSIGRGTFDVEITDEANNVVGSYSFTKLYKGTKVTKKDFKKGELEFLIDNRNTIDFWNYHDSSKQISIVTPKITDKTFIEFRHKEFPNLLYHIPLKISSNNKVVPIAEIV